MSTALEQKNYRVRKGQKRFGPGRPRIYANVTARVAAWRKRKRIADQERRNAEFLLSLENPT